jgi:hypothetical protein
MLDSFDFTYDGQTFHAEIHFDDYADAPWENSDGHGIVSDWTTRAKRPGEWVLNKDRNSFRYYDAKATLAFAIRDGWGCPGFQTEGMTRKQVAAEAVRRDFEYLKAWCNDDWHYVGVCVFPLDDEGNELKSFGHSCWGIESESTDYIKETANELAREALHDLEKSRHTIRKNARFADAMALGV